MKFKVLQAFELLPDNTCFVTVDKMEFSLFFALMKNHKKRLYNLVWIAESLQISGTSLQCVLHGMLNIRRAHIMTQYYDSCEGMQSCWKYIVLFWLEL